MSEIKQCPYCAYDRTRIETMIALGSDHYESRVMCLNCGAYGPNSMNEERAAKSWNMRREIYPPVKVGADTYKDLRQATPEELLKAAQWFYRQNAQPPGRLWDTYLIRLGWQLERPGGWRHCAPWWLRESRKIAALDG